MSDTAVLEKSMKMPQIKEKAGALGIRPGRMKKTKLIHAIQQAEGFNPCFGLSDDQCEYAECCFRRDCLKTRS